MAIWQSGNHYRIARLPEFHPLPHETVKPRECGYHRNPRNIRAIVQYHRVLRDCTNSPTATITTTHFHSRKTVEPHPREYRCFAHISLLEWV
jgi:hypothetical protein